jgi:hypothetical protein
MGSKSLMKKIIILTSIFGSFLISGSLSSEEIINMVAKIKEERTGISLVKLEDTVTPFIMNVPPPSAERVEAKVHTVAGPVVVSYKLKAVLNHAAFINNKWYKKGDKLGNYRVGYVSKNSVTLNSNNDTKVLRLEKKKKKFIKLNQGHR